MSFLKAFTFPKNAKAHLFIPRQAQLFHSMPFRKLLEHNMAECKYLLPENSRTPDQEISLTRLMICYNTDFIMGKIEKQKEKKNNYKSKD